MTEKDDMLATLKAQWKVQIEKEYKAEPEKVKASDVNKTAEDIVKNPIIKMIMRLKGIKKEDIVKTLTKIKQEVIV
jgi:hypothetical protein